MRLFDKLCQLVYTVHYTKIEQSSHITAFKNYLLFQNYSVIHYKKMFHLHSIFNIKNVTVTFSQKIWSYMNIYNFWNARLLRWNWSRICPWPFHIKPTKPKPKRHSSLTPPSTNILMTLIMSFYIYHAPVFRARKY